MLLEMFVMGYSVMANPTATAFLEVLNDRKKQLHVYCRYEMLWIE